MHLTVLPNHSVKTGAAYNLTAIVDVIRRAAVAQKLHSSLGTPEKRLVRFCSADKLALVVDAPHISGVWERAPCVPYARLVH